MKSIALRSFLLIPLLASCSLLSYRAKFVEPEPRADTHIHEIELQQKQAYVSQDQLIQIDNQFDGARMNACKELNDSTFSIRISPENHPINASPWYAFRIISKARQQIWIQLNYEFAKHRYLPKTSTNRSDWTLVQDDAIQSYRSDSTILFPVQLNTDTTWVSGQEIINSKDIYQWISDLATPEYVGLSEYGSSKHGKALKYLDLYRGKKKGKPIIVITGRQHPPEITGYLAMKSFLETILDESALSTLFLQKYRVLVYPLTNPDGVDLGNWRHNAEGVDLNRDWGSYHQPEIRQVCDHIVTQAKRNHADVVLGLDFHSTQQDILYTNKVDAKMLKIGNFKDKWFQEIEHALPGEKLIIESSGVRPVATSKNWFSVELGAEGIIYEVGDNTPRKYIQDKANVAAQAMMNILTGSESSVQPRAMKSPESLSISLFNGKNLDGWHMDIPKLDTNPEERIPFIVRDGNLVSLGTPEGHLITDKIYENYRLEVEYRFAGKPGNCGVLIHASSPRALYKMFPKSIEAQMQHEHAGDFWCIVEDIVVPDMVKRRGPEDKWGIVEGKNRRIKNLTDGSENPLGEWNEMIIECRADTIEVWVNNDRVNFGTNCTAQKGQIALQAEGSEVEFRKVQLTQLK